MRVCLAHAHVLRNRRACMSMRINFSSLQQQCSVDMRTLVKVCMCVCLCAGTCVWTSTYMYTDGRKTPLCVWLARITRVGHVKTRKHSMVVCP